MRHTRSFNRFPERTEHPQSYLSLTIAELNGLYLAQASGRREGTVGGDGRRSLFPGTRKKRNDKRSTSLKLKQRF